MKIINNIFSNIYYIFFITCIVALVIAIYVIKTTAIMSYLTVLIITGLFVLFNDSFNKKFHSIKKHEFRLDVFGVIACIFALIAIICVFIYTYIFEPLNKSINI